MIFLGSYSSAPPLQTPQQYYQQPAAQLQYPPAATAQYGGGPAPHPYPPAGYAGAPSFQGQWTRPPPGGARPPPPGAGQHNYYNNRR